jgi:hypothetical protein
MLTVKEMARIAKVCGGTIYNGMKAYDRAIAEGREPPRGAIRYTEFGGHRLSKDIWFAEALGIPFDDLRAIEARSTAIDDAAPSSNGNLMKTREQPAAPGGAAPPSLKDRRNGYADNKRSAALAKRRTKRTSMQNTGSGSNTPAPR